MADDAVANAIDRAGKGIALKDVVEHDKQGSDAAQPVEQFVVGFSICKAKGGTLAALYGMTHDCLYILNDKLCTKLRLFS